MGSGIFFPISALPIILILMAIFYVRGHIVNEETKVFNIMLISNLVGLVIEILCAFACRIYNDYQLISLFVLKTYLVYTVVWTAFFTIYIYRITYEKDNLPLRKVHWFLLGLIIVIIYLLPINVVIRNNYQAFYTNGLAVSFSYLVGFVYVITIILILLMNLSSIKTKKYFPVFLFFIIGTVSILIQINYPQILLLTYSQTIICLCMFFTIENPDVKMIQQLELAREQADKANQAKTDFLSSMSHEIRTPLNAIVGFSECVMDAKDLGEAKENARDIVNASQTLLEIVNGILDISKIEAGKLEIVNSKYDAVETFEDLAKLITPKMKEKGLDFTYNIAPDLPRFLFGDHANLKKIVTNLLSNACKYTDRGYVHYEVNCVNSNNVSKLIISVEDSGRGIKKQNIDKMFTKFQRLEADRNTTIEGTGLGLAITKQLIELMGGRIIVHTVYGEGSKFTVVLNQRIESKDAEIKKRVKTTLDLAGVRILLVDDTALNLKVATKLLEKYNANHIVTCDSGFECIDRIKRGEIYDLILLDDMMPKMSGVETLKKLKEIPAFKMPTIALTANAITGMREKYLADGFDDYLAKPIEKEQLISVINQILGRSYTEDIEVMEKKTPQIEQVPIRNEEIPVVDDMEKAEEERQSVIPVEDNIEEILGDSLERSYQDEPNAWSSVSNSNIETLNVNPVLPIDDLSKSFNPTAQELEAVNESVKFDEQYLRNNGVDLDHALELLGDMEMYNMTISDFVKDVEEKWNKIVEYKDKADMPNYAIEVHSLKSDCKYLGFMTLADISYQHELKSKENDLNFVQEHFDELFEQYQKVLEVARTYVEHNPVNE